MSETADVVVIGDDVWQLRFAADPGVLGREIQLGSTRHTIVGVMPAGYRFPVAHSFWIPLRLAASYEPLTGPQRSYLETLAREAGEDLPDKLTKAEASELIERLQEKTGRGR